MGDLTKYGLVCLLIGTISVIIEALITFATYGGFSFSISGIFFLIGIILMFVGRKEYGEKHRKYVVIAGIIFLISIITIILFVVGIAVSMFSSISAIQTTESVDLSVFSYFYLFIPITAFLNSLFMYFLLYNLEDETGKKVLFAAILSAMVIAVVMSIIVYQLANEWIVTAENAINEIIQDPPLFSFTVESDIEEIFQNLTGEISKFGLLGIIPNILYLIALYLPFKRINSGELKSIDKKTTSNNFKYCNNCGRPVPIDSIVCPYCGKSFNGGFS